MPSVSVVIRTLNEGGTLDAVLTAIQRQGVTGQHLIVVDSGSSDDTLAIAKRHGARILQIDPDKFTYGYALNLGLTAVEDEFAVSLAGHALPADDNWLAELLRPLADKRVAGASSKQLTKQWLYRSWALTGLDILYHCFGIHSQFVTSKLFVNSSSAIRMAVWRQLPFAEDVPSCEDQLWSRQVLLMGLRIAYCPRSRVYHYHHLSLADKYHLAQRDSSTMRRILKRLRRDKLASPR